MPARRLSLDAIRAELAWVNQEPDPNRCGCRNVLCCEREHHAPGACTSLPTTKLWMCRWSTFAQRAANTIGAAVRGLTRWRQDEFSAARRVPPDLPLGYTLGF